VPENDKVGSAALLLMVKRGLIKESEILDGSFFHACAREIKFILRNQFNIV
jgi:hypothetical protein